MYGRAEESVSVVPRAARVPIVPRSDPNNTLYPELYPYVYRSMQELPAYPGPSNQYPAPSNQYPTAPTATKTTPEKESDQGKDQNQGVSDKGVSEIPRKGMSLAELHKERMVLENSK